MRLEVDYDTTAELENPREWSNAWVLVPVENMRHSCLFDSVNVTAGPGEFTENEDVDYKALARLTGEKISIAVPVYMAKHGDVVFSRRPFYDSDPCRWDWGIVGIAYLTTKARKEFKTREHALEALDGELDALTKYANGEIWEYRILDDYGNIVDCCGGYFSEEEAEEEGKRMLEYYETKMPRQLELPLDV